MELEESDAEGDVIEIGSFGSFDGTRKFSSNSNGKGNGNNGGGGGGGNLGTATGVDDMRDRLDSSSSSNFSPSFRSVDHASRQSSVDMGFT